MIALNEEERPCLSVGAPLHPPTRSSSPSDADSEYALAPAKMELLLRVGALTTAGRMLAPFMQALRESDGETFAAELVDDEGFTVCSVCHCRVSNRARLDCSSGCAA